jgi:hypothetical protein
MDELEQSAETLNSDAAAAAAEEHDQAAQQQDDQVDNPDSQEQADEDDEVEIGGKKVAMPKSIAAEVKAGMMRNADYTQKTQAVAAERKAVEAEREQVRQQAAQQEQYAKEVAKVHALDDQLAEFKKVDWQGLSREDPALAQQLRFQYDDLQQKRNEAAQAVTQKQHEQALAEQQSTAKQVQEAEAYVQREIPGWTQERATKVQAFAAAEGVKLDAATAKVLIQNPALLKIMHKAELFDQLAKKQTAKPAAPAAPPAPVTRVGAARATAAKDPDKMPMDEWVKWRSEQRRKR